MELGFILGRGRELLFSTASGMHLGSTQPAIQQVEGALSPTAGLANLWHACPKW